MQDDATAVARLIRRIERFRGAHGWSEAELARRLEWDQSRLNRCINEKQRFTVNDLDALAAVLGLTVPELFFDDYGQWDRRRGSERRQQERRHRQQAIYDPTVEPSAVEEVAFTPTPLSAGGAHASRAIPDAVRAILADTERRIADHYRLSTRKQAANASGDLPRIPRHRGKLRGSDPGASQQ